MSTSHSISRLLPGVKQGDEAAVYALFTRCYQRVVEIAKRNLHAKSCRGLGDEDLAQLAFHAFLDRAALGRFRQLENREDVWQVLTMLVVDKMRDRLRHDRTKRRGGGMPELPITDLLEAASTDPALEAEFADVRAAFLASLPSNGHREVVALLEEDHTHEEIALRLGVSVRTVYRRLDVIRSTLPRMLGVTISADGSVGGRSEMGEPHE